MSLWLLGGSLAGVLLTAGLVAWLGLGRDAALDDAARVAEDLVPGFESAESYPDEGGKAALVAGRDGSWCVVRLHGLHPVARHFAARPPLVAAGRGLRVRTGDARFGDAIIANDKLLTLV